MTQSDDKKPRKERVIHTRVPAVLDRELKRLATNLKVPVSNVVRTILQDTLATIDSVGELAEDELRGVAERLHKHRDHLKATEQAIAPEPSAPGADATSAPPLAGVVGYQQLLLARDESCTLCGSNLAAGSRAYLGIREVVGPRVLLDPSCLPFSAARSQADPPATGSATTQQEDREDD